MSGHPTRALLLAAALLLPLNLRADPPAPAQAPAPRPVEAPEALPAPLVMPIPHGLPPMPPPFPPPYLLNDPPEHGRMSYWRLYAVDRFGRFRPLVVPSPYGDYYLYNHEPYPWANVRPEVWRPAIRN